MVVQTILRRFAQMAVYALVLIAGSAQAIDLRKDLSEKQFKAAGLLKLESAELDELQRLIDATSALTPTRQTITPMASKPAQAVTENSPDWRPAPPESERTIIETELTDAFKGLFGATKVTLANGQVWQQTDRAVFDRKLRDRRVRIKPGMLGGWRLQFVDNNLSFTVKRVH